VQLAKAHVRRVLYSLGGGLPGTPHRRLCSPPPAQQAHLKHGDLITTTSRPVDSSQGEGGGVREAVRGELAGLQGLCMGSSTTRRGGHVELELEREPGQILTSRRMLTAHLSHFFLGLLSFYDSGVRARVEGSAQEGTCVSDRVRKRGEPARLYRRPRRSRTTSRNPKEVGHRAGLLRKEQ
jgi:hypothetical protein